MPDKQTRFDYDIIQTYAGVHLMYPPTESDRSGDISFARNDLADSGLSPCVLKREKDKWKTCTRNLARRVSAICPMSAARLRSVPSSRGISRLKRIKK